MGAIKPESGKVVKSYLKRYPQAYKLTLAKMIVAENPGLFANVEDARGLIRYYTKQNGRHSRDAATEDFMDNIYPTHTNHTEPLHLSKGNAMIIGDIHGLTHHYMLRDFFLYAKKEEVDTIILNGDIVDFDDISRFPQMDRTKPFQKEVEFVQELLCEISDLFPDARKIYKIGNHELWWDRELWRNAKLMSNEAVSERLKFEDLLNLRNLGYDVVYDRQPLELGKLTVFHGHEAKRGGKYIANTILEYYKKDVCFNHFHRVDFAKFDVYGGNTIKSYALPCARNLDASYTGNNNQWVAGFGICNFTETDYEMRVFVAERDVIRQYI